MAKRSGSRIPARIPDEHTVTELDQIRALADPLRQRILAALTSAAHTTKQIAGLLKEKPTRLYHHVEILERAGLIRLTETRPNRGTVEKYYRAVAFRFRVASSALNASIAPRETHSEIEKMLGSILESAQKDLLAQVAKGWSAADADVEEPFVGRVPFLYSEKALRMVRDGLLRLVADLRKSVQKEQRSGPKSKDGPEIYALTFVVCRTKTSD
jgi:DNA-binding transcriptional ArsR family regulator